MNIANVLLTMYAVYNQADGSIGRSKLKTVGYTQDKEDKFIDSLIAQGNTNIHFGIRIGRIPKGELNTMTFSDVFTV